MQWFTETMHVPWLLGLAAILAEYFILGLALAAIVALYGGGAASVDRVISGRLSSAAPVRR